MADITELNRIAGEAAKELFIRAVRGEEVRAWFLEPASPKEYCSIVVSEDHPTPTAEPFRFRCYGFVSDLGYRGLDVSAMKHQMVEMMKHRPCLPIE